MKLTEQIFNITGNLMMFGAAVLIVVMIIINLI